MSRERNTLPMFVIYRGHIDLLQHLQRFIRENDALPLKLPAIFGRNCLYWYRTLHGITIPTWAAKEEWLLREKATYQHNLEFLRNVAAREIGQIDHIPRNPVLEDQNEDNPRSDMDDYESGEVTFINVIQFKGVAWKLELGYKLAMSRLGQKLIFLRNPWRSSDTKSHYANNPNSHQHQRYPKQDIIYCRIWRRFLPYWVYTTLFKCRGS